MCTNLLCSPVFWDYHIIARIARDVNTSSGEKMKKVESRLKVTASSSLSDEIANELNQKDPQKSAAIAAVEKATNEDTNRNDRK